MRILITGASGRLGSALNAVFSARGHDVTALSRDQLDMTDFAATRARITSAQPELVLNPAAWTDVDGCAREPERATRINGFGAQNIALAAVEVGAAVVYVSTNEVFDGRLNRAYYEYDVPNPPNAYGYSKWVGEQGTMQVNPKHYIVRSAWLFANGGKNFIQTILNAAQAGDSLRVVANEVANPTYTNDLADSIAELVESGRYGTYHLVNEGWTSRYDFARYALDRAGFTGTPMEKISTFEWNRLSTPPPYCGLVNLAGASVGVKLRPWQEAVDAFLRADGLLAS